MQTVPIKLPQALYASYRRACTAFVWGKSYLRLSYERLTLPKLKGGIGFPDIAKYHWACQLTRIIDWNIHAHTKAWININNVFSSIPLCHLTWTAWMYIPQHPLISNTLQIFKKACHKFKISSSPGPLTPIRNNPGFPPGLLDSFLSEIWPHTDVRAEHFFSRNTFLTLPALSAQMPGHSFPFWMYIQLQHILNNP